MNTFYDCKKFEKDCIPKADKLLNKAGAEYVRWKYSEFVGKTMQNKDIDLTMKVDGFNNGYCHISEKFRSGDYGDMMIELYSNYKGNVWDAKQGWGMNTEADYIFYYTPERTYIVNAKQLKLVATRIHQRLFNNMYNILGMPLDEYFSKHGDFFDHHVKITPIGEADIRVFKIPTVAADNTYYGICITSDWETLEKLGVEVTKYDSIF